MSNIFIFHGTEGYPEENWFPWLKEKLEKEGHKVFIPHFPSPPVVPAKLSEWNDVFDKYRGNLNKDSIIIGHSLGGVFALKVLEKLNHSIKAVFLTGTPIGIKPLLNYDRDCSFAAFDFNWEAIRNNAKSFIVFHSDNDPYVSLGNGETLAKYLGVDLSFVPNAGHFNKKAGYMKFHELWEKFIEIDKKL